MFREVFLRTQFNYDVDAVSEETGLKCEDGTRTQQQFKDECDINEIMRRFGKTGQVPSNVRAPMYGDFTEVGDF